MALRELSTVSVLVSCNWTLIIGSIRVAMEGSLKIIIMVIVTQNREMIIGLSTQIKRQLVLLAFKVQVEYKKKCYPNIF